MKRFICLQLLISISLTVVGTNYYVRNGGNDLESGLTDEQAWAHHPWMITWTGSIILKASDTVFMKRGDLWTIATLSSPFIRVGQSGTNGRYITTTCYGTSDEKPVIEISGNYNYPVISAAGKSFISFDQLEIRHYSSSYKPDFSQSGIIFYSEGSNVPHDWIITNCDIHNIPSVGILCYNNAFNITIGDTTATNCASSTSFSNHIYECGYSGITLCGRNPVTNISNFKIFYNYVHDIDPGGSILRNAYGISFTAGSNSDGWPSQCIVKYNRMTNNPNWAGLDCHGGTYIYFQNNYVYNCSTLIGTQAALGVGEFTPILDNLYIENNILENPGNHAISNYHFLQIGGYASEFRPKNCIIKNNTFYYTSRPSKELNSYAISIVMAEGVTIENNKFYNGPLGLSNGAIFIGNANGPSKNITIKNNWIRDWFGSIYLITEGLAGYLKIFDNVIYMSEGGGSPIYANTGISTGYIELYNNTILTNDNATSPYAVDFSRITVSKESSFILKNNIFGFTQETSSGRYVLAPKTIEGIFDIDYNIYWNSSRTEPFYFLGPRNLESWNKLGYDIHSIFNKDPLFRNLSGSYKQDIDFDLQSNSPAIDKGTYVGLLTDYLGAPINGLPDIGAFEYQAGTYTPSLINSLIENWSPNLLEMNFNSLLNDKQIPDKSAFIVNVNGSSESLNNAVIEYNKILLTLNEPVTFGDNINISYYKPDTNWIESNSGNPAQTVINQPVTNNCRDPSLPNDLPEIVIDFQQTVFSGFIYELDVSDSYDLNNDKLTFSWEVPPNIPVSDTSGSKIKLLTPIVTKSEIISFNLSVTDGIDTLSREISITLMPYKPEFSLASIRIIEASDYYFTDYPNYVGDGNLSTKWSIDGDNHWLTISMEKSFNINYLQIAFLPDQRYESYFDIYASEDSLTWEPVLTNIASCSFSGALQNFDFPIEKTLKDYSFLKLVGHGNSLNSMNEYSEIKIFGNVSGNSSLNNGNISIFPNPVKDIINILILEPPLESLLLKMFDFKGLLCFETLLDPMINNIQVPINYLKPGAYIVQILSNEMILFTQTLILSR
ncbi:MAG: hypothetical protein JXB17_13960 [Bacteroidales bacterium]|nr:hypothetical protein [Bacteroidales bacterium]